MTYGSAVHLFIAQLAMSYLSPEYNVNICADPSSAPFYITKVGHRCFGLRGWRKPNSNI
jgi:hypothetical protein